MIFLGPGVVIAGKEESIVDADERANQGPPRKMIVFPGRGVALPADASPAMEALAHCLGDVAVRLDREAEIVRLMPHQEAELMNWDAEKYRQALDNGAR